MAAYLTHQVQSGETLQQIAAEKLHNVNLWQNLVEVNHLKFPYIVRTEREKSKDPLHLVTYGDTIILATSRNDVNNVQIPDQQYLSGVNSDSQQGQHIYDSVLGMDLQLGFGQDSVGDEAPGDNFGDQVSYLKVNKKGTDVKRVWGIRNLLQSITIRLITDKGTLPYHPEFGSRLNQFIGTPIQGGATHASTAKDISNEIERTALTDTRVTDAHVIKCILNNENFFAILKVTPIKPFTAFSVYVQSINGNHINVSLDRDE